MSEPYESQNVADVICFRVAEAVRKACLATGEQVDYATGLMLTEQGPGVAWVVVMPSHLVGQKVQNFGVVGLDTPADQIEAGILAAVRSMMTTVATERAKGNGSTAGGVATGGGLSLGPPLHLR